MTEAFWKWLIGALLGIIVWLIKKLIYAHENCNDGHTLARQAMTRIELIERGLEDEQ